MGKVVKGETTLSLESIPVKVRNIISAAENTVDKLQKIKSPEDFLFKSKFGSLGTSWAAPEQDDDLGEQIQQSMTMLVTCYARQNYFSEKKSLQISPGDKNGPDLFDEELICEVFSAKNPWNNDKLYHDLNAVVEKDKTPEKGKRKYVFYCSDTEIEPTSPNKLRRCSKKNIFDLCIKSTEEKHEKYKVFTAEWKNKESNDKLYNATIVYITQKQLHDWIIEKIQSAPSGVSGLSSQGK